MEQTVNLKKASFTEEELQKVSEGILKTHQIKLNPYDLESLKYGEKSSLLTDLKVSEDNEQKLKDAKLQLGRDKDGNVTVHYHYKKQELEIPKQILDKKLDKKEEEELRQGKKIGPIKKDGKNYFVGVDKELNSVTVYSDKEVGVKKELGEYKFSDVEMEKLANSQKVGPRIFKGESGYFMAELTVTPDKRGLHFSEIKELSPERAKELLPTVNKHEESKIESKDISVDIVSNIAHNKGSEQVVNVREELTDNEAREQIKKAVDEKDYKVLYKISEEYGIQKDDFAKDYILSKNEYTREDKITLMTCLNIDTEKVKVPGTNELKETNTINKIENEMSVNTNTAKSEVTAKAKPQSLNI